MRDGLAAEWQTGGRWGGGEVGVRPRSGPVPAPSRPCPGPAARVVVV